MKTVRLIASALYGLSKAAGILLMTIAAYATLVLCLHHFVGGPWIPVEVNQQHFRIFYPFTHTTFLLGDYTLPYLITNIFTIFFYGIFLLLLSSVFHAFKQVRIFTHRGVERLSRFYKTNLLAPVLFLLLLLFFGLEMRDILQIILLHISTRLLDCVLQAGQRQGPDKLRSALECRRRASSQCRRHPSAPQERRLLPLQSGLP